MIGVSDRASHADAAAHARQILARGFTTYAGLVPPDRTGRLAQALRELWHEHGEPRPYSRHDIHLADGVEITPVGFTVHGLLARIPAVSALLRRPELLALFRELLGDGFELEMVSGIVSDHTRPFFFWHNHVGGIDGEDYRGRSMSTFRRPERLVCTFYLSPLDDEHGMMLVYPRAIDDPLDPPLEPGRDPWPGALEVRAPAGSVLVVDQATWHAVTPMSREAQRSFVGAFVRRAGLAPTVRRDASVERALASDADLARAYGRAALQ